jgi:hypothetical protein
MTTPGRPFTRNEARHEHEQTRCIREGGDTWLAPREAVRLLRRVYVKASQNTLRRWANLGQYQGGKGCPWLDGEALHAEPKRSAYNREFIYYSKRCLTRIMRAKAKRVQFPKYRGFVHVLAAAQECGVSCRTMRRGYKDYSRNGQAVARDMPAQSNDGRALPRSYVPREFVDWFKERRRLTLALDDISIREAAQILGLTTAGVHSLIRYGRLEKPRDGKITCKGGYPRKAKVLSRASVEAFQARRCGRVKPEPYTDREGTWLPRPLALERFRNIARPFC